MKKQFRLLPKGCLFALVWCGLFCAFQTTAQTAFQAKLDKTTHLISLDESKPVGYLYQVNFSDMNFASKDKADAFFGPLNTDLVTFQVDFDKRIASLFLNTRGKSDWTVKDWNAYLADLTKK